MSGVTTFRVRVQGDMLVEVNTSMLDAIEDPSLAEEITHEAVKMAVCDRLGGFSDLSLARERTVSQKPKASFEANVNFENFASCIENLQKREEVAVEALRATRDMLEVCMGTFSESSVKVDEVKTMLATLLETTRIAVDKVDAEERPSRSLSSSKRSEPNEATGSRDASSSSSGDSISEFDREREAMGYQRLLDCEEEVDGDEER